MSIRMHRMLRTLQIRAIVGRCRVLAGLAAIPVLCAGCSPDAAVEKAIKGHKASYEMSSNSLVEKYGKSQIDADAKFKGKIVEVTGNAASTSAQLTGGMEVILKDDDTSPAVRCMFAPEHKNQAENLHGEVTIKGKCDGWNMGVVLRGCTVE